jgi:uncharacterized protein
MREIQARRAVQLLAVLALLWLQAVPAAAGDLRLLDAVKNRQWSLVPALVPHVDVDARQPDGATALLWAAQWDHLPTAERLVTAGADVNAANDYGVTPLFFAASNGSPAMTALLLKAGANADTSRLTGETALMTAARTGNVAVVQALLAAGADVSAREADMGQDALIWALAERHLEVVRLLLEHRADTRGKTKNGFTPLLFAVRHGSLEAVRMLIARGADVNETATDGTSPLLMAVVRGHVDIAELLLGAGADPNASAAGFTALHWVAGTWESAFTRDYRAGEWPRLVGLKSSERLRLMAALLSRGADVNARVTRGVPRFGSSAWKIHGGGTAQSATPFFFAASVGDVEVMRFLLAHGADPHLPTRDKTTPFIAAAGLAVEESETRIPEARHLEAVKMLLDLGADVRSTNNQGDTALHGAAFLGYDTVAQLLLERGGELNARNKQGQTPYRIALGVMVTQMFFEHPGTAALLKKLGGVE